MFPTTIKIIIGSISTTPPPPFACVHNGNGKSLGCILPLRYVIPAKGKQIIRRNNKTIKIKDTLVNIFPKLSLNEVDYDASMTTYFQQNML